MCRGLKVQQQAADLCLPSAKVIWCLPQSCYTSKQASGSEHGNSGGRRPYLLVVDKCGGLLPSKQQAGFQDRGPHASRARLLPTQGMTFIASTVPAALLENSFSRIVGYANMPR